MQKKSLEELEASSYLSGGNAAYLEQIYDVYLANPENVSEQWRRYFKSLPPVGSRFTQDASHAAIQEEIRAQARQPKMAFSASVGVSDQERVDRLIDAFRRYGHREAKTNPLPSSSSLEPRLQLGYYGLKSSDLDQSFETRGVLSKTQASLQEIFDELKRIYCGSLAFEYTYIENETEQEWLRGYIESTLSKMQPSSDQRKKIAKHLVSAEGLEKYLDTKYVGQTRFSLEGGDSFIPMLHELIEKASQDEVREVVIAMAHRGRLNMLFNVMGMSAQELFHEFEGSREGDKTSGDVKYHIGYSADLQTNTGPIHLSLAFNPSHLEFISPVAMGSVRARQDRVENNKASRALTVMVHGDAAFTGQGVVMETLNLSKARGYDVGGSLHLILNNQVGFTTSDPEDARSARYASGPAKMIEAPIIHVNADDPEATIKAIQLAMDYRHYFNKDVVVDLVCYRRYGHNEADEPSATQPLMYQQIRAQKSVATLYCEHLIQEGLLSEIEVTAWKEQYADLLDQGLAVIQRLPEDLTKQYATRWAAYLNQDVSARVDTGVPLPDLEQLIVKLEYIPPHFELQRQVGLLLAARNKMWAGELPLDWGAAETLAYATLLAEGHPVRFTGQDVRRGTFAHRHAAIFDQKTGEVYMPLAHLSDQQARLSIYDSTLSETAVLAFEYGYSTTEPDALVIWEAQYGDFANGAQVIIDQFITSGWQKWQRMSGLVLMLPHGQQSAGPEHSSARLERFMQMAAEDNIQICVPTTPAQIFHLLRRQVLRPVRVPLIIMTPKGMLRNKLAVSPREDLTKGGFQWLLPELDVEVEAKQVSRVIICCGKVYYDLLAKRRELKETKIAMLRIEQLYPFPYEELKAELEKYSAAKEVVWCQEEPMNQGAWFIGRHRLSDCLAPHQSLSYAGREAMAAPSPGYPELDKKQQYALIEQALKLK